MHTRPDTLSGLCQYIARLGGKELPPDHKLGSRLVCPEYSHTVREAKNHPLLNDERIFALCWDLTADSAIHASLCPSPEPFHYQRSFQSGEG